ncbi:MAG: hypothetical protein GY788_11370 [bacterium]|nr:hypothetical protein [bacterium]
MTEQARGTSVPSTVRRENAVLILGMHRSGTSCLAGSLQQAGLFLGDVVTSSAHNQKGNRENKTAMKLHEEVLIDNGGTWSEPPETVDWNVDHNAQLDAIVASYAQDRLWGIKDPRILLLHDAWAARLKNPRYVGSIRHPLEVVKSIQARQPKFKDTAELFAVWHTYNSLLLDLWAEHQFPIVNFNSSAADYAQQIETVSKHLGLVATTTDPSPFFESALIHQDHDERDLPIDIADLYQRLLLAARGTSLASI